MTITERPARISLSPHCHLDEMALNHANQTIAAVNAAMIGQIASLARECEQLRSDLDAIRSQPNRRPLLTKQQTAEYLAVSIATLDNLIGAGDIPVVRLTGPSSWPRFRGDDLDNWIESRIERHND